MDGTDQLRAELVRAAVSLGAPDSIEPVIERPRDPSFGDWATNLALTLAILWISLVAISRLVLGVHWPTDVLVAACIGAFLPLAMSVVLELCCAKTKRSR